MSSFFQVSLKHAKKRHLTKVTAGLWMYNFHRSTTWHHVPCWAAMKQWNWNLSSVEMKWNPFQSSRGTLHMPFCSRSKSIKAPMLQLPPNISLTPKVLKTCLVPCYKKAFWRLPSPQGFLQETDSRGIFSLVMNLDLFSHLPKWREPNGQTKSKHKIKGKKPNYKFSIAKGSDPASVGVNSKTLIDHREYFELKQ